MNEEGEIRYKKTPLTEIISGAWSVLRMKIV
jgi:hypothetical protein